MCPLFNRMINLGEKVGYPPLKLHRKCQNNKKFMGENLKK